MRIHFSSSMDSLLLISGDLCIVKHSTVCMMRYRRLCRARRAVRRSAATVTGVCDEYFIPQKKLSQNKNQE